MYPVFLEIGGFTITTFGVMMFLSFVVGAWVLSIQLERRGFDRDVAWDVLFWIAIGGIVGAKLYYLALHWQDLVADPVRELTGRGGLVWYGGLIGGVLAYYWQVRRRGLPVAPAFDATAPALMLSIAIGRVGCFLVGDDYGLPTDSWVGVAFPNGAPPSTAGYLRSIGADVPAQVPDSAVLAVHPTQLYEVGLALILFAVLWKVSPRLRQPGRLFGLFLALYAVERFLIEFVRAKDDRFVLGLSTSQLMSVLLVGVAAYLWTRKSASHPAAVAAGASAAK
ncbi:MAG TPA: prolipoprotein diacylglyceryl transferase [Longimicrobiales bacterium]